MHLTEGELRQYYDKEVSEAQFSRVRAHLEQCPVCQEVVEELDTRVEMVSSLMGSISPSPGQIRQSALPARARMAVNRSIEQEVSMWKRLFARRYQPVWVTAAVILIVALALLVPSVRAVAINFLGLFRVEQIAVVEVNPANLPEQLGSSNSFEQLLAQNVQVVQASEPQLVASLREAQALLDFAPRLPRSVKDAPELLVQYGAEVNFNADVSRLEGVLGEIGRSDIQLPDSLQNAKITLNVPPSLMAGYGECNLSAISGDDGESRSGRLRNCTLLMQMTSPTISAPPGLDIAMIGQAFLQVMGMSAEEAANFSEKVDWATTLVVPIPRYGATYEDVQVDGVQGTLITQDYEGHAPNYMLIWVNEGRLYVVTATGDAREGMRIANSLE